MGDLAHWDGVYRESDPTAVSWYEPLPKQSLELIESCQLDSKASILDVGGGASSLGARLVGLGHSDVSVADISERALAVARRQYKELTARVSWIVADLRDYDFGRRFDLWHDRAVLHFMTEDADRAGYMRTLRRSLAPQGHLVIATFGPEGPTQCSGLPVRRYGPEELAGVLGSEFDLVSSSLEDHGTPGGNRQQFLYTRFRRVRED